MMRGWTLLTAALLLTGCPASAPTGAMPGSAPYPYPGASKGPGGALGNLVGDALTVEENELRAVQKRPQEVNFPPRVGILFYDYQTSLKPEDQQAMLTTVGNDLVATGLVKSTFQIPSTMLRGGDNIDAIRKLSARFQIDVLLIVSGSQAFQRAESQPLGFFDSFSNRAYYEARTSVTAIALNIYTGTFLTPFQTVGKEGPALLDADAADYATGVYALRQRAEISAFNQLKAQFIASMETLKTTAVPPGTSATPTPSPSPTASASLAPSPSPSAQ